MQARSRFLVCSFTAIILGACASASVPVHNFAAVPINAKSTPTLDDVGKAIIKAGAAAGWQMSDIKPGNILATYKIRSHLAVVEVTYSPTAYNIAFKSGDDSLRYNSEAQTIHQNYNGWVENLDVAIRTHVNAL
jgi:hypothetical protein